MEDIWDMTQVLLVPSVWCEAWSLVVVEAQIRGIPVIASDAGALVEAKLGVPYTVPVKQVTGERNENDYIIPPQDTDQWVETLTKLMTDRHEYERISDCTRDFTGRWVSDLDTNT
jgi:glycosyltransferase involved in cell wall biosynthesis